MTTEIMYDIGWRQYIHPAHRLDFATTAHESRLGVALPYPHALRALQETRLDDRTQLHNFAVEYWLVPIGFLTFNK